jgi:dynein heavy chain, axonemal
MLASLQNYSRKKRIPIDELGLDFQVLDKDESNTRPENGVYVNGIFMEGARWDRELGRIVESRNKSLYDTIPIIWFQPNLLSNIGTKGTYNSPVYKTSARRGVLSTTGHSTNFVMGIRFRTDSPDKHWIMRGVACLLQLDD